MSAGHSEGQSDPTTPTPSFRSFGRSMGPLPLGVEVTSQISGRLALAFGRVQVPRCVCCIYDLPVVDGRTIGLFGVCLSPPAREREWLESCASWPPSHSPHDRRRPHPRASPPAAAPVLTRPSAGSPSHRQMHRPSLPSRAVHAAGVLLVFALTNY
jgi:hypothetical protein